MGRWWGLVAGACALLVLSAAPSSAQGRDAGVRPDLGGVRSDYYEPRFQRPVPPPRRVFRNEWYRYRAQDRARWARQAREYRNEIRRAMREYQKEIRDARREYQQEIRRAWRNRRWR